ELALGPSKSLVCLPAQSRGGLVNRSCIMMSALLLGAVALLAGCGEALPLSGEEPPGGNNIFRGHYVFHSVGKFPGNSEDYFEDGVFEADGFGQAHLSSAWIQGEGASATVKGGLLDDDWSYTISNFKGTATSTHGDSAHFFCTQTGKVCQMIADTS